MKFRLSKLSLVFLISQVCFNVFISQAYARTRGERDIYSAAQECATDGQLDFAFMHFRSLLKTSYRQEALFATGEYYFGVKDYSDASAAFIQYLKEYPDPEGKPFALAYLLRIKEKSGNAELAKELEKKILTLRQNILLFKDSKEYEFRSPLGKDYKLIYYIYRLEFYINGELFAKVSY